MMGFYIYPYTDSLKPKLTNLKNNPKFLPMNEISETLSLLEGDYIVMCCLYKQKEVGKFSVQCYSHDQFEFSSL